MVYRIVDPIRTQSDVLTDEEWEVQQALVEYKWEPDNLLAFTPTRVLYRLYRQYIAGISFRETETTLSRQQFGVALRRVYPFEDEGPDPYKVRRRWHGRKMNGYLGLVGPETIESKDTVGRNLVRDVRDPD